MNLQIDNEIEALSEIFFDNMRIIHGKTNKTIEVMLIPSSGCKLSKGELPYCWVKVRIEYFINYPSRGPLVTIFEKYNLTENEIERIEARIKCIIKVKIKEKVEMVLDICQVIQEYLNAKTKQNDPNEIGFDNNDDNDNNTNNNTHRTRKSIENRLSTLSINTDQYDLSNDGKNPLENIHEFAYNGHISDNNYSLAYTSGINNNNSNSNDSPSIPIPIAISNNKEDESIVNHSKKISNCEVGVISRFVSDFEIKEKLGEGGGGSVFKVKNKWDGMYYAIKLIRVNIYDAIDEKDILLKVLNEGYILSRLQHPHIVRYYQTWIEDDLMQLNANGNNSDHNIDNCYDISSNSDSNSNDSCDREDSQSFNIIKKLLFIQMEYCEGKTLKEAIENKTLSEIQKWKLIIQLLEAINYIHQQSLIHRDIKPGNIFLDKNNEVKIGDFGLAKVNKKKVLSISNATNKKEHIHINGGNDLMTYNIGTKYYCSPEQEKQKTYDSKTDMFSIGIIMFEMFYSFSSLIERDIVLRKIKDHHIFPEQFLNSNKKHIGDIVSKLTKRNSADRPSAKELLHSPLIPVFINEKAVTENFEKIINDNKDYIEKFIDILIKLSSKDQSNNYVNIVLSDHYYTKLFRKHLKKLPQDILEKYHSISIKIKLILRLTCIKFQCKGIAPFIDLTTIYDSTKCAIIPINILPSPLRQENIMLNRSGKMLQFNTPHSLYNEISSYIRDVQNITDFHPCQLYSEINYEIIYTQLWSSSEFCDRDEKYIINSFEKLFGIIDDMNIDKSKIVIKLNSSKILDTIITKSSAFPNDNKKYEILSDIQKGRSIKSQKTLVPFFAINGELETIKKKNDKKEFNEEIDSIIEMFNPDLIYWSNKSLMKYYREKVKIDFSLISSNLLFYSGLIIQVIYQGNENEGEDIIICEGGNVDNLLNPLGDNELFYHAFSIRFFIEKLMMIRPIEEEAVNSKLDVLIVCCDTIDHSVMSSLMNKMPPEPKIEIDVILKPQSKITYQALERVYKMKVLIVALIKNKKVLFDIYYKDKVKQIREEDFKWSEISQLLVGIQFKKRKAMYI